MTRALRRVVAAALTLLSVAAAPSTPADEPAAAFAAAQAEFERGLAGESGANDRAHERFRRLVEQEPGNPLYVAYYGSTFAILGKGAWAPWNKMKLTERGLGLLEKAVSLLAPEQDRATVRGVPVSEEVRLTAASTFLAVPGLFHRTEAARLVLADALASPAFAATPPPVQARLLAQAALLAQRDEKPKEEADALRRALALAPDGAVAARARARLKEIAP